MSKPDIIKILMADDHSIVRSGLVALIHSEPDMIVVAQASDGTQAAELYAKYRPDVAMLDLRMPGKSGNDAIDQIRQTYSKAHILVLTAYSGDEDIHKALEAGALGYALKSSTSDDLISAIRAVAAGQRWIPRDVASLLAVRNAYDALSHREIEVLKDRKSVG